MSAPTWRRSNDDLRAMWSWVRCDFERFLEMLQWLDALPQSRQAEQYEAAQWLKRHEMRLASCRQEQAETNSAKEPQCPAE